MQESFLQFDIDRAFMQGLHEYGAQIVPNRAFLPQNARYNEKISFWLKHRDYVKQAGNEVLIADSQPSVAI